MAETVQVRFRLEPAELQAALHLLLRGVAPRLLPIGAVLALGPIGLLFTPARPMAYGLWAALVVLCLAVVRFVVSTRASLRGAYARMGEALYQLSEDGLTVQSPGGSFALPWSAFVNRREGDTLTILRQANGAIVILPHRAFAPAERAALAGLLGRLPLERPAGVRGAG